MTIRMNETPVSSWVEGAGGGGGSQVRINVLCIVIKML